MFTHPEQKKIPILMYHSISHTANPAFKPFAVAPSLFADQMAYLYEQGYTPITVTQFVHARAAGGITLPERPIVLTFDDGYADFFTEALPILKRYKFPATLYVTTAYIDGTSRWLRWERETMKPMLSWSQLQVICENGIECGGHTHSHPQLDVLPLAVAQDEIQLCKSILEDHLQREVTSFAYPFGYFTTEIREIVYNVGYSSACAVQHAFNVLSTDVFALKRLMVSANMTVPVFAALLHTEKVRSLKMLYMRARTPVWQFVRRCSALTQFRGS